MDIGARLRNAREARGLTIDALSRSTRIQPRILTAIEGNDLTSLPPRPYVRGFVRTYASEVGLDPETLMREYFSQFEPEEPAFPESDRRAGWRLPIGAILAYAAIGTLVIVAGRWSIQGSGEPGAVGTSGAAAPVPASEPAAHPTAAPPRLPTRVAVALEAKGPAWMSATVDGRRTVYRLLQAGETLTLDGTREIVIRTGDAGAVTWRINGRTGKPMGLPGEVRTVRVTRDGQVDVIAARRPPLDGETTSR
jgi:hypothetical protein